MRRALFLIAGLGFACSGGAVDKDDPVVVINNDNNAQDGGNGGGDGGPRSDVGLPLDLGGPTTEPDGPMILDFSVTPQSLTQGGTATFNVLLSDPQGFADIGGGRLLDRLQNVVGLFTGTGGSYTFALTWDAVHALEPISFDARDSRVFTAEFFDAADHRATQSAAIEFHCDGDPACDGSCGLSECSGSCVDPTTFVDDPANCGMCGRSCPSGVCIDSDCSDCRPLSTPIGTCDPLCQTGCQLGEACAVGGDINNLQSGCLPEGPVQPGNACAMDQLCVAGSICVGIDPNDPANAICATLCRLGGGQPGCSGADSCLPISGNTEVGACGTPP